jgi:riboflavin kinase/FMN adenylyltransferase
VEVLRDPLGRDEPPRGAVLSIGNFDGVHVGHQTVLRQVAERAEDMGVPSALMTFDPHPIKLLRPHEAPALLTTIDQRVSLLARTGIDVALVVPFTHKVARMEAMDFVERILVERLAVRQVLIGANFRFGADRRGDVDLLVEAGRRFGFEAAAWPTVSVGESTVSSTRVRTAVRTGDVAGAREMLGRAVFGDGRVQVGKRLGRRLGFPTLNIELENELFPAEGVYVTAVYIPSFDRVFPGVTNVGVRPTVYENSHLVIESHLLDFTADVYDERVRIFFLERLRDERAFASPMQLMAQIQQDVEAARLWLLNHPLESLDLLLR